MIMEKNVKSFVVFAKITLYIQIFFKTCFKGNIPKMSIEGTSEFRVTNKNFWLEVKVILKFRF